MPDRTEVFMPATDDQHGRLSLIEAIRANTDAVNRLARHGEMQDKKLDRINDTLGKIDTRLTLLERDTLKTDVARNRGEIDELKDKVGRLEAKDHERVGGLKFLDAVAKYGPMTLALVAAFFILLIATGKVVL
jgi:hypothetical protein